MRRRALIALGIFLALGAGAAALLLLRPPCLILEYTGFYCAGCGTQRMVLALLRGDLKSAAGLNIFMLAALPAAGIYAAIEAVRYVRGERLLCRAKGFVPVLLGVLAAAAVFTLLRNQPGLRWLAPA